MYPSCTCHDFLTNLLPCRHIARVYVNIHDRVYEDKETIHPYWHVSNHPLYNSVKSELYNKFDLEHTTKLGIFEENEKKQNGNKNSKNDTKQLSDVPKSIIDNKEIQNRDLNNLMSKIPYPKTPSRRYAELNGLANKLIDCAKLDKTIFRITKIQLNKMIETAQQLLDKGNFDTFDENINVKDEIKPIAPLHRKRRGGYRYGNKVNNSASCMPHNPYKKPNMNHPLKNKFNKDNSNTKE